MSKPGKKGIARIIDATGYSIKGFKAAWINEAAFRQEAVLFFIGLPLAYWLSTSTNEFLWLTTPLFIVLLAEMANSAIEAVVDRVGSEHHELSGRAKDMGSALVFVSLSLVVFVWTVVLLF